MEMWICCNLLGKDRLFNKETKEKIDWNSRVFHFWLGWLSQKRRSDGLSWKMEHQFSSAKCDLFQSQGMFCTWEASENKRWKLAAHEWKYYYKYATYRSDIWIKCNLGSRLQKYSQVMIHFLQEIKMDWSKVNAQNIAATCYVINTHHRCYSRREGDNKIKRDKKIGENDPPPPTHAFVLGSLFRMWLPSCINPHEFWRQGFKGWNK